MGRTFGLDFIFKFIYNFNFDFSNIIDVLSIVVNSALALWIVRTIQSKLTNQRVLKDYFIEEFKEIRSEYRECLKNIYNNNTNPKEILQWFKLMNIRINDLMNIVDSKYNVDSSKLLPFQLHLNQLIVNDPQFISHYRLNTLITFSDSLKRNLVRFEQSHNNLFNEIIITINDAK